MSNEVLSLSGVTRVHDPGPSEVHALRGVSLDVGSGELVAERVGLAVQAYAAGQRCGAVRSATCFRTST